MLWCFFLDLCLTGFGPSQFRPYVKINHINRAAVLQQACGTRISLISNSYLIQEGSSSTIHHAVVQWPIIGLILLGLLPTSDVRSLRQNAKEADLCTKLLEHRAIELGTHP